MAAAASTSAYDPLDLTVTTWLTPTHELNESAPADGAAYFAAITPATAATPIASSLTLDAPVTLGSVDITLVLGADAPIAPAQDASGNAIEVALLVGAKTIAKTELPFSQPVLAPGATETLHASLKADGTALAAGDRVTVSVTPTLPALADHALKLSFGAKASAATFTHARVASVAALGLDEGGLQVLDPRTDAFAPPHGAGVYTVLVHHASVEAPQVIDWIDAPAFVVLRGDEPAADAHAHDTLLAARRAALAHAFRVDGVAQPILVVPGIEVVVPIGDRAANVTCVARCPADGFHAHVPVGSGRSSGPAPTGPTIVDAPGNVLVPPPPATNGIEVSKDAAPPSKTTPAVGPALGALTLAAAAASRRRR